MLALFVFTLVVGYIFILPTFDEIKILMDEKQKYSDTLDMVSNIMAKQKDLQTKFDAISSDEKISIDTVLPDNFDFVKLVSDIDAVASKYGISIGDITSREVSSSVGDNISEAGVPNQYQSATIGFSFKSSYEQFNSFVKDLEKSMRLLDIKSAKIESSDKGVYNYTVEFQTYWLPKQ